MISHDRAFLNALVDNIFEIRHKKVHRYRGNYDAYVEQRKARQEQHLAAYKNQQAEIQKLKDFAARFGAKASKASQAQSKLKQIERMDILDAPESDDKKIHNQVPAADAQRPARDDAEQRPFRLRHAQGLPGHRSRDRKRPAHGAGRAERRGQVDAAENPRRRPADPAGRAQGRHQLRSRLLVPEPRGHVETRIARSCRKRSAFRARCPR